MPSVTKSLATTLAKNNVKLPKKRTEPLWAGPCGEGSLGGVTFSSLSRFLCCRERFRVTMIEGIKPVDRFQHRIEYGQMWHTCEEAFSVSGNPIVNNQVHSTPWFRALMKYCSDLLNKYPTQRTEIQKWAAVCSIQFPHYINYWKKHPDVTSRTPLLQEQVFDVPYKLPSGRAVRLRGKWDGVDLIGKGKQAGVYLFETKTKGDVKPEQIERQLKFDLQTMMYAVALQSCLEPKGDTAVQSKILTMGRFLSDIGHSHKFTGVRYNVITRPLSGGKGSIVQHKGSKNKPAETDEAYYDRLGKIIEDSPQEFFRRWKVDISARDIELFKQRCLNPLLEQLCDWYEWVTDSPDDYWLIHWQHPFGVYNSLDEGGSTDLDLYLSNGDMSGLRRVDTLFTELQ